MLVCRLEYLPQYLDGYHICKYIIYLHENERGNKKMCNQWKIDEPNEGLYITWVDEDDMVEPIDYPREWCSGTTAIHLACQQGAQRFI